MTPQEFNLSLFPLCICGDPACKIPYGLCHCGCGRLTTIASMNRRLIGHVKGSPVKMVVGHGGARHTIGKPERVTVDGDSCHFLNLTRGKRAIVIDSDYEKYGNDLWFAHRSSTTGDFYAARKMRVNGKMERVFLHRLILGLPHGDCGQGDHKNGNTLDDRPRNLRPATQLENSKNRRKYRNNTSGYKGVSFNKRTGKWVACIFLNGKNKSLGSFRTPETAYAAYCAAAKLYYGEFARFA